MLVFVFCLGVVVDVCAAVQGRQIICSNDRHQERRERGGEMIHPTSGSC